jgi:CubicO group peptidase (beta-lactamase class C family)
MPWLLGLLAIFACKDDPAPAPPDTGDVPADVGCTADTDDARILALMDAIDSERVSLGATAASVALVVDGALVWCGGFGDRHPSDGGEVDGQTLFRMGSVNKMMTAVALLQQVESGAVSLDAPVTDTLPDFKMSADPRYTDITAHHLLTHQGAFYDYLEIDSDHEDAALEGAIEGWFDSTMVLLAEPGLFWNYSNPNWYVAGRMAEAVDGRSYVTLMDEAVFDPLGMSRTGYDADWMLSDGNYVSSWTTDWTGKTREDVLAGPDSYDNAWARPAGYAWTSAEDLGRFALFLLHGDPSVLSDSLRGELLATQVDRNTLPGYQGYSYGLFTDSHIRLDDTWYPVSMRSHGGDISGFAADLYLFPEESFAVAFLAAGDGAHFSQSLLDAIVGFIELPAPVDGPELTVDPEAYPDFAGSYTEPWDITGDFTVSVTAAGELAASFPLLDQYDIPYDPVLYPSLPDSVVFVVQDYPFLMTFIRDEGGSVTHARTRLFVGEAQSVSSASVARRPFSAARLEAAIQSVGPRRVSPLTD